MIHIVRDMTQGSEVKQIVLFTIRMLVGAVFQQMYNMVDSIVVGRFVGPNALAAVAADRSRGVSGLTTSN